VTLSPASALDGATSFVSVTVGFLTFTARVDAVEVEEYVKVPLLL
jgi:hypothetical protein